MSFADRIYAIFAPKQLFDMNPAVYYQGSSGWWIVYLAGFVLSLVALIVVSRINLPKDQAIRKHQLRKMAKFYMITFLVGVFLLWARSQYVTLIAMPFWMLTLISLQIGMLGYFAWAWIVRLPRFENKYHRSLEKERYLPKS